ncbi:Acyl-CoA thioesterase [Planctomycetales bacterium 10988]|nr:Acyl-CoA thioesterase [Planctomycetales bacterium 10988]
MSSAYHATRRVEFSDTDMAGIVHFSSFFHYMEEAEHALLRSFGMSVVQFEGEEKISWPRVKASCQYTRPVRFEDMLDIEVRIRKLGRSSVEYEFLFFQDGHPIATGEITAVCCRFSKGEPPKPIPLSESYREQAQQYLKEYVDDPPSPS